MSRIATAFGSGAAVVERTGVVRDGETASAEGAPNGGASQDTRPAPRKAFIAFVTGGDPSLEHSERYIRALVEGGADLIEIGVPFSDPIAEGPVIQEANLRALAAGTTLDGIFELVRSLRRGGGVQTQARSLRQEREAQTSAQTSLPAHTQTPARAPLQIPIVLLTYLNPVHHYGYQAFFATCAEAGVDGIIIPDLPYDEKDELADVAAANGVDIISLIAPTSAERITTIATDATGYIYLVSSMGVTGVRSEITTDLAAMVALIRAGTDTPIAVGFGIHTPEQARAIIQEANADGAIVGSAIVRMIAADPEGAPATLAAYAHTMKAAMEG